MEKNLNRRPPIKDQVLKKANKFLTDHSYASLYSAYITAKSTSLLGKESDGLIPMIKKILDALDEAYHRTDTYYYVNGQRIYFEKFGLLPKLYQPT